MGDDESSKPLVRLGAGEAPKANTAAGVDDVDVPEETVFSDDLNISPAFCGLLLSKIAPSANIVLALLQHNTK